MEVQKEAQRIMTMSVWKMYHSRMQRGGLRLHRSLQLSLVMRNARDLYLSAKLDEEEEGEGEEGEGEMVALGGERGAGPAEEGAPRAASPFPPPAQREAAEASAAEPEPMETQQEAEAAPEPLSRTPWPRGPSARPSRKRRSSSSKMEDAGAGLVPSKKAKLAEEEEEEEEGERHPPQGQEEEEEEGPFPSLARVLQDRFSGLILSTTAAPTPPPPPLPPPSSKEEAKGSCRQGEGVLSILVRAVVAF